MPNARKIWRMAMPVWGTAEFDEACYVAVLGVPIEGVKRYARLAAELRKLNRAGLVGPQVSLADFEFFGEVYDWDALAGISTDWERVLDTMDAPVPDPPGIPPDIRATDERLTNFAFEVDREGYCRWRFSQKDARTEYVTPWAAVPGTPAEAAERLRAERVQGGGG